MHQKLIWLSVLSILLLILGASGLGAVSHRDFQYQSTLPHAPNTAVASESSRPALIAVTGKAHWGWGTLLFFGLIALAALTLILALLDSANRSTALYVRRKPLHEDEQKN